MKRSQAGEDQGEGRSMKLALSLSCGDVVYSDLKIVHQSRRPRRVSEVEGVYECKTCHREFPSFQALGGHRTSHLRPTIARPSLRGWKLKPSVHKCPICGLGFAMGQALGGHMRRHRSTADDAAAGAGVSGEMTDSMTSSTPVGLVDGSSVDRIIRNSSCHDLVLLELFK